jgi:hypothetical protein
MNQMLMTSPNPEVILSVRHMMKRVFSISMESRRGKSSEALFKDARIDSVPYNMHKSNDPLHISSGVTQASILSELGFAGLLEAGDFNNVTRQRKVRNASLVCAVVDATIRL